MLLRGRNCTRRGTRRRVDHRAGPLLTTHPARSEGRLCGRISWPSERQVPGNGLATAGDPFVRLERLLSMRAPATYKPRHNIQGSGIGTGGASGVVPPIRAPLAYSDSGGDFRRGRTMISSRCGDGEADGSGI